MDRISVRSSNIRSVGFDASSSTLEVEFESGSVYQYFDVPKDVYEDFMNASSLGKFSQKDIKGKYRFVQVA